MCDRPRPGPLYWDWRCLRCSGAIPPRTARRRWARKLVRWVSGAIEHSYLHNVAAHRREERRWARIARRRQAIAFPLARRLDRDAMGAQMVEECWWG